MTDPVALLNKVLEENNLIITLGEMKWRAVEGGALIIEKPTLSVSFAKEVARESSTKETKRKNSKTA